MYEERKAAEVAAYLLFKAGAEGMSRRRLLALMYLAEREGIKRNGMPLCGDAFMLTEDGPVMERTCEVVMGGGADGASEWLLRVDGLNAVGDPAMVAEAGVAYAERRGPAAGILALRDPQPPPRWPDGTPMGHTPRRWTGREEGMPYLGRFSRRMREVLGTVWDRHGRREEEDLMRHVRELPECGGAVSGALAHEAILRTLGYTEREIKGHLAYAKELDAIDRYNFARDGYV